MGIYTSPSEKELLLITDKLPKPNSELQKAYQLYYLTQNTSFSINPKFSLSEESQENLLFKDDREIILIVKELDLLGKSKWVFKHEKSRIEAKVADLNWLESFKNRTS
ncbi:hypothetical protein [Okeania sp.]|uniref:hypothetical protein n=1 Tax=Okeania sp. TaxID=3100323 RepID=UPI002B4ABB6F|nr:hypothetical protein [Okeania sp.]MEB3341257.1 hypothetical protein [Okeania sp.]